MNIDHIFEENLKKLRANHPVFEVTSADINGLQKSLNDNIMYGTYYIYISDRKELYEILSFPRENKYDIYQYFPTEKTLGMQLNLEDAVNMISKDWNKEKACEMNNEFPERE